jgi:hypothetical protein
MTCLVSSEITGMGNSDQIPNGAAARTSSALKLVATIKWAITAKVRKWPHHAGDEIDFALGHKCDDPSGGGAQHVMNKANMR